MADPWSRRTAWLKSDSTPVQRRHEDDVVVWLQLVAVFAFELPVGIIDQDQDSWSSETTSANLLRTDSLPTQVGLTWHRR